MYRSLCAAIAALCVFAAMPCAAAADDETIDEIIVSADYQQRTLADIPASISALSQDTIERAALTQFEELAILVPNLNWAGGSNRIRYFQLRGIGERSQYEGAPNPSVGFIIDDIDFSGIGGIAQTWDVERIEVLRGPQATRYGANALAGLIYMQSVAPGDAFDARASATFGGDDLASLGIAFGGPITERIGYRIATQATRANGFRDNAFSGADDSNERDETFVRARLRFTPDADTRVDLTALWAEQDNGYDAFALDNGFTTYSNRPGRDAQRSRALSLRAGRDAADRIGWTSITSFAKSDIDFSFDADWGNQDYWFDFFAPPADAPFVPDYDYFSQRLRQRETLNQEFRLQSGGGNRLFADSTDWLVGIYWLRLRESLATYDDGTYTDGSEAPFFDATTSASDYRATSLALFAQTDSQLDADTTLSVGLRAEQRGIDYADDAGLALSPSERAFGGHISLRRAFGDALSGYLALSRGYKMGGFNLGPVPDGRRTFDAESLLNLELGLRWQGESSQLAATVFAARRRDQQVDTSFQLVANDPSTFVFFQDNAASGNNLGLELEAGIRLHPYWRLRAALGLLDVTFDEFVTPDVDLSGREQAHAPGYTAALSASFDHPRGWFARLDVSARDAFYFSNSHDRRSEAYALTHAKIGRRFGQFEVSAFARNLFNQRFAVRGFFFGNEPPNFADTLYLRLGDPRQLGVSLNWQY